MSSVHGEERTVVLGSLHLCAVVQSLNLGSYIRLPAVFVSPKFSLVFMINRIIVKKNIKDVLDLRTLLI